MRNICLITVIMSLLCCLPASARIWTFNTGRRTDAEFKGFSGNNVKLKSAKSGKLMVVPVNSFSKEDQEYLKRAREEIELHEAREAARKRAVKYREEKRKADMVARKEEKKRKASEINVRDSQGLVELGEEKRGLDQEKGITELIGIGIIVLGGIVTGLGALMMLAEGFNCGFFWGIISALPGVGWILFALPHWQVAKKSLLIEFLGIAIAIGGAILAKKI